MDNRAPVDGKTVVSFGVGMIAGMSNLNPSWATLLVISFEAILVALEEASITAPFKTQVPDSVGNFAVDTIAGIYGVYAGEEIRRRQLQKQAMEAGAPALPAAPVLPAPPDAVAPAVVAGLSGSSFLNTQFPLVRTRPVLGIRHVPQR